MYHRLIRQFFTAGAGALLIGMIGLAPARAQDYSYTPRQGKGRWQGTHAKRTPASVWGRTSGARQTHQKDSLWGNEAHGVQPPSPWGVKRSTKGLNSNPPSPWTSQGAARRNFGAGATVGTGRRQAFRYGSRPTHSGSYPAHSGKWTSTRSHASSGPRRWTQNTTPGAWKLKQKAASKNWKSGNGKHNNRSQMPIQTGLPDK